MAILELKDLIYTYNTEHKALFSQLNLALEEGDFCFITGEVGSGKSTLLRCCIPCLLPPGIQNGAVYIEGQDVRSFDPSDNPVAFVDQDPENQIVCDTVWHELAFPLENMGLAPQEIRLRVAELAHWFGVTPWFKSLCSELSGGQKQLVNLLSALSLRPRVLLLDEPCAQLDPVAAQTLLHTLFRLNKELGMTIVVVSHSPENYLDYATRFCVLEQGRLNEVTKADILSHKSQSETCFKKTINRNSPLPADEKPNFNTTKSPVLTAKNLYFKYSPENDWLLQGLNLELYPAQFQSLVGGNGSGKSTLLFTLAGALKPQKGSVEFKEIKRRAFLPQDPKALFTCDTVFAELTEYMDHATEQEHSLEYFIDTFKLKRVLDQHPYDLSGGQQQLVALAKILITAPQILFLDEPTTGLDAESKRALAIALSHAQEGGCACFMASHDLEFAEALSDSISLLFEGDIVASGNAQDFFDKFLFYKPRGLSNASTCKANHA